MSELLPIGTVVPVVDDDGETTAAVVFQLDPGCGRGLVYQLKYGTGYYWHYADGTQGRLYCGVVHKMIPEPLTIFHEGAVT